MRLVDMLIVGALAATGGVVAAAVADRVEASGAGQTPAGTALMARLAAARGGEVIRLEPKDYGAVRVPPRAFSPGIRIEAAGARFSTIVLNSASGVAIVGGTVAGPGGRSYAIQADGVSHVRIEGMTITGSHRGIVLGRSSDVVLLNNRLTGLISDGIDIALAQRVQVRGNRCSDFTPQLSTFAADGRLVQMADHPDCIQAWSRPGRPPTADLVIEDNIAEGRMQGIFLGNKARAGIDDGGFDRVIIRNNTIRVQYLNGIALTDARDSEVMGNQVSTMPGGRANPRSGKVPVATIRVDRGARNRVCGNRIADLPDAPATRACG